MGERAHDRGRYLQLVNKNTFETIATLPSLPGKFNHAYGVEGLGIVFHARDVAHDSYYIAEEAYKWLGSPPRTSAGQHEWPEVHGFVFLGSQERLLSSRGRGRVDLHVDGADGPSPRLVIHEVDDDDKDWVRWGPWEGPQYLFTQVELSGEWIYVS